MSEWKVEFHEEFFGEFEGFSREVQDELYAVLIKLKMLGPQLGRPHADTLKGSKHKNLKELRFSAGGGVWRAAYAFDPERKAIVLVAGDKSGVSESRFYKSLISKADLRYDRYLDYRRRKIGHST